jgi:hypothetical protein
MDEKSVCLCLCLCGCLSTCDQECARPYAMGNWSDSHEIRGPHVGGTAGPRGLQASLGVSFLSCWRDLYSPKIKQQKTKPLLWTYATTTNKKKVGVASTRCAYFWSTKLKSRVSYRTQKTISQPEHHPGDVVVGIRSARGGKKIETVRPTRVCPHTVETARISAQSERARERMVRFLCAGKKKSFSSAP